MKELSLTTGKYLVLPLPEGAKGVEIEPWANELCWIDSFGDSYILLDLDQHPGQWTIIGTTKDIAENEVLASRIIEKQGHSYSKLHHGVWEDRWSVDAFYNYMTKRWRKPFTGFHRELFGELESFASLCQFHNIPQNSIWLKKETK